MEMLMFALLVGLFFASIDLTLIAEHRWGNNGRMAGTLLAAYVIDKATTHLFTALGLQVSFMKTTICAVVMVIVCTKLWQRAHSPATLHASYAKVVTRQPVLSKAAIDSIFTQPAAAGEEEEEDVEHFDFDSYMQGQSNAAD